MVMQDAYEAAQAFLDRVVRPENDAEIVISTCEEAPDEWRFGYDSRRFLELGDISFGLAGNGPVIVPKSGAGPYIGPIFRRPAGQESSDC